MPKSRGKKDHKKKPRARKPQRRKLRLSTEATALLKRQHKAFRAKFGRDPGPDNRVFFDAPDEDIDDVILGILNKAEVPPEFLYAFRKTGLLGLTSDKSQWEPERIKEWDRAVEKYRTIQAAGKRPGKPDPTVWSTTIPELLTAPFGQKELDQVRACLRAIAPIEAKGMKLVTRIELAAAFLVSACEHGYDSSEEVGERGDGPEAFERVEELVLRRAREIYAQGGGG